MAPKEIPMTLVAQCSACRAKFEAAVPNREAVRVREMAARFVENHLAGSPGHEVVITETPPREDAECK
jgi:hypothetical protein